jgi:hypothetical protein
MAEDDIDLEKLHIDPNAPHAENFKNIQKVESIS